MSNFNKIKFILISSSQGSLDKNLGSEKAAFELIKNFKEFEKEEVKIEENNLEKTNSEIEQTIKNNLKKNKILFSLGGDHSISYPLTKTFFKKFKKIGIIIFDAHADCVNSFEPPSHEDWLRTLIEKQKFPSQNILLLGLRNVDKIEEKFLKNKKVKSISCKNIKKSFEKTKEKIVDFQKKFSEIYLSLDIDILDSKITPGTGYPEKNGLTQKEFFSLLKKINFSKIKGIDLVEINPLKDKNKKTISSGIEIIKYILNFLK